MMTAEGQAANNLVSLSFVVHAPAPHRPDYFACQPTGRHGAPVLNSRTNGPVTCKNCQRIELRSVMDIYLLTRNPRGEKFEEMQGCVVIAESPKDARILASAEEPGSREDWLNPSKTTCESIGLGVGNLPRIILTDINWG